jgi:hypothetical protein
MKHGFKGVQEEVSEYPHTLRDVPEGMFPLFLTQGEFLKMLDGTLAKPFWPRTEDGSLKHPVDNAFHEEAGMLDEIPDEDFEYFSDNPDDAHGQSDAEPLAPLASAEIDKRVEIDFKVFQTDIWPKLCNLVQDAGHKRVTSISLPGNPLLHQRIFKCPAQRRRKIDATRVQRFGRQDGAKFQKDLG